MDKNRIDGLAKEARGSIKEAIGKLTGNPVTEAEGKVEKTVGKAQAAAGESVDAMKDALRK